MPTLSFLTVWLMTTTSINKWRKQSFFSAHGIESRSCCLIDFTIRKCLALFKYNPQIVSMGVDKTWDSPFYTQLCTNKYFTNYWWGPPREWRWYLFPCSPYFPCSPMFPFPSKLIGPFVLLLPWDECSFPPVPQPLGGLQWWTPPPPK